MTHRRAILIVACTAVLLSFLLRWVRPVPADCADPPAGFDRLGDCMTGPGVTARDPECFPWHRELHALLAHDGDIDLTDYAEVQRR